MSNTSQIAFALIAGFIVFITVRGELPAYLCVIGLGSNCPSPEATAANASQTVINNNTSNSSTTTTTNSNSGVNTNSGIGVLPPIVGIGIDPTGSSGGGGDDCGGEGCYDPSAGDDENDGE